MSTFQKALDKFLERPARNDLTFQDAKAVLSGFGFTMQEREGSRVAFVKKGEQPISLHKPHPGNELKVYLVKQIQERIKKILDTQQ